ncbi:MAG TPA: DegV family protein [candidate division Zixibacteria bacterium]|nr:DegV family protein [candidate division Zixibacteria bacterium]
MTKKNVALVTCAAADIPPEIEEKYQITIVPVLLNFEDKSYRSYGIEKGLTWEEFYKITEKEVPSTGIPGPGHFVKAFEEAFKIADTVIVIFISYKMSGMYQLACKVVEEHFKDKDIHIYHGGVSCVGTAALVYEAAKLAENGKSKEEIIAKVEEWIPHANYSGIINTLDNLVKTGRLSKTKKFFADILKFKPVLGYVDDELHVYGNIRADDAIIINQMKKFGEHAIRNIYPGVTSLFVNHSRWPEAADEIANYLRSLPNHNVEIIVQETGVINSFFTGKKLLAFGYIGDYDPDWLLKTK